MAEREKAGYLRMREGSWRRAGFTIVELAAAIAIVAVLVCVAIPGAASARSQSKLAMCIQNLHGFANATSAYAADFDDKIWTFSWRKYNWQSQLPPGQTIPGASAATVTSDFAAASAQAIYLLRTRAGRQDITYFGAWMPYPSYSHLPLIDYLRGQLPEEVSACPEDSSRLNWQRDPVNLFDEGHWLPFQPAPDGFSTMRWAYSSSYQTSPSQYDRSPTTLRINQQFIATSSYSIPPAVEIDARKVSDAVFPSAKVHLLDEITRHRTRGRTFFTLGGEQPYLMFDGAVPVVDRLHMDNGWVPTQPTNLTATQMTYTPQPWDLANTKISKIVFGGARWTRHDLEGADFYTDPVLGP